MVMGNPPSSRNVVTLLRHVGAGNPACIGRHSPSAGMRCQSRSGHHVSRLGTDRFSLPTCSPAITLAAHLYATDVMIFRWFESLIDAFKEPVDGMPPQSTWRFYAFYLRQVWPVLPAANFFQVHGWELLGMALVALVARPLFNGLHDLLVNQSIVPNLTNRIRWQNHRYVMRQSLGFFQNDYAGRIANRIMQTGASLRSSAVQIVDAIWYVVIYTGSAIALFARADVWLALPLFAWVFLYVGLLWFFVPRLKQRSWQASAARSKLM